MWKEIKVLLRDRLVLTKPSRKVSWIMFTVTQLSLHHGFLAVSSLAHDISATRECSPAMWLWLCKLQSQNQLGNAHGAVDCAVCVKGASSVTFLEMKFVLGVVSQLSETPLPLNNSESFPERNQLLPLQWVVNKFGSLGEGKMKFESSARSAAALVRVLKILVIAIGPHLWGKHST
jgi:hypothetical protein